MKLFWQSALMFNTFVLMPGSLIFLIYSFGALLLLHNSMLFSWALTAFLLTVLFQGILGILSE
jgi:hypothetical protein